MRLGLIGNRTKLLIGSSGSGKSVFCATMLEAYIRQGAHAVVADIGHSYRNLCTLLDGIYLTYSKENPLRFNPFVLEDGFDTEKMESIKALLLALWKKDDEAYNRSEYVALSTALQLYYDRISHNESIFPVLTAFMNSFRTSSPRCC